MAGTSTAVKYRSFVKKCYGKYFNIIDPFNYNKEIRIDRPSKNNCLDIVMHDQNLIYDSDIFVAYIQKGSTFGTTMEIKYASMICKDIYIITSKVYRDDIWLKAHANKIFFDIVECWNYLKTI